jgi:hypothetical protein
VPVKDLDRRREIKRLSEAKRRAKRTDAERDAVKEEDSKRKATARDTQPVPRKPYTGQNLDAPFKLGALQDRLSYNEGADYGGPARRGHIKSQRKLRKGDRDPAPHITQRERRELVQEFVRTRALLGASGNERRWIAYVLLKADWDAEAVDWLMSVLSDDLREFGVEEGRRISQMVDTLSRKAQRVAAAIRRVEEWRPQTIDDLYGRCRTLGLEARDVDDGIEELRSWGLLDTRSDHDGRLIGYMIRTDSNES